VEHARQPDLLKFAFIMGGRNSTDYPALASDP
jgi:hypothetical protein